MCPISFPFREFSDGFRSPSPSPSLPFRLSIYYSLHFFPILYAFIFGRIRQVGLDRFRSRIRGPARPGESSREEGKLIVKGGRWKKEAAKQTAALSSDLSFEGTRRFVLPSIRRISDLENSLRSTDKSGVGSSGGSTPRYSRHVGERVVFGGTNRLPIYPPNRARQTGSSFKFTLLKRRSPDASRLEYSPDKTVSFPSQSIFARPTHSRL